jgi:hypothetical protein
LSIKLELSKTFENSIQAISHKMAHKIWHHCKHHSSSCHYWCSKFVRQIETYIVDEYIYPKESKQNDKKKTSSLLFDIQSPTFFPVSFWNPQIDRKISAKYWFKNNMSFSIKSSIYYTFFGEVFGYWRTWFWIIIFHLHQILCSVFFGLIEWQDIRFVVLWLLGLLRECYLI